MAVKAIFHRKEPELDLKNCSFDRVVVLPDSKYRHFLKNMQNDYDFIDQYREEMYQEGDVVHCILVKGENSTDGILVNSEGGSYARYAAYFPAAAAYLKEQEQQMKQQSHTEEMTMGGM